MIELPPPTPEVTRLVSIIGPEATFALIEARSPARIYVPHTPDPDGELVGIIGLDAALALCKAAAGEYLKVPVAREWRILAYRAQGRSYLNIARALGCSLNTVWRVLNDHYMTAGQLDLFDR